MTPFFHHVEPMYLLEEKWWNPSWPWFRLTTSSSSNAAICLCHSTYTSVTGLGPKWRKSSEKQLRCRSDASHMTRRREVGMKWRLLFVHLLWAQAWQRPWGLSVSLAHIITCQNGEKARFDGKAVQIWLAMIMQCDHAMRSHVRQWPKTSRNQVVSGWRLADQN